MPSAVFTDSRFRLDYTLTTVQQDIPGNRTLIRRRLVIVKTGSSYAYSGNTSSWSSSGPTNVSGTFTYDFGSYSSLVLMNRTEWVTHNADGSRSVTSSAAVSADAPVGSASIKSFTTTLPKIPRATIPTVSPALMTGQESTITLPRAVSTYTHEVSYSIGSKSGEIAVDVDTSTVFTPPDDLMTELPAAASGPLTIIVVTKNGSTTVGATSTNFTLTAGPLVVPAVSGVLWDDANPIVKANIGAFVQSLSLIKGTVVADGVYGSTIAAKQLLVGANPFPENTTFQVNSAGVVAASGSATDSRGRVGTADASFMVLAYEPPKLGVNGWQVNRANNSNVVDDNGTYLRVDLHAIAKSLVVGTEKNALQVSIRTRPTDGAWTQRNIVSPGLVQNGAIQVSGGGVFLVSQSYEVEITLTDNTGVSPLVLRTTIGTTVVAIDIRDNRVGIGKMHEYGVLDVAGDIYADGVRVVTLDDTATESAAGLVERATQAEVTAGADASRYVTPATLAPRLGLVPVIPESIEKVGSGSEVALNGSVIEFQACTYLSLNGVFTEEFENYRLLLRLLGAGPSTYTLYYRLRSGGVDKTSADQRTFSLYTNSSSTVAGNAVSNSTAQQIGFINNLGGIYTTELYAPAVPTNTRMTTAVQCYVGGMVAAACYDTLPYDGLTLFNNSAVALSGTLQVLGYNRRG